MIRVDIGIHLDSEPERLDATLAHLRAASAIPIRLVLLPDGPDIMMRRALESYRDLTWSGTDQPRGAAACFNRLLRLSKAPLVVFLEAGSLVGPGWLERLIAVLDADPKNGLA